MRPLSARDLGCHHGRIDRHVAELPAFKVCPQCRVEYAGMNRRADPSRVYDLHDLAQAAVVVLLVAGHDCSPCEHQVDTVSVDADIPRQCRLYLMAASTKVLPCTVQASRGGCGIYEFLYHLLEVLSKSFLRNCLDDSDCSANLSTELTRQMDE